MLTAIYAVAHATQRSRCALSGTDGAQAAAQLTNGDGPATQTACSSEEAYRRRRADGVDDQRNAVCDVCVNDDGVAEGHCSNSTEGHIAFDHYSDFLSTVHYSLHEVRAMEYTQKIEVAADCDSLAQKTMRVEETVRNDIRVVTAESLNVSVVMLVHDHLAVTASNG